MLGGGVVIPAQAVSLLGATHTVLVQVQPGVFESREVVLGYQGPREAVVSRGLEVGEQVVSENMLLLARTFRTTQDAARPAGKSEEKVPAARTEPSPTATKTVAPASNPQANR